MINLGLLNYQLQLAGLPTVGLSQVGSVHDTVNPSSFYAHDSDLVRVDWAAIPTALQDTTARGIVQAHNSDDLTPTEQNDKDADLAKVDFRNLPNYATWTPAETQLNITNAVLNGKTLVQVNADIDALPNSVAGMKVGLKTVAQAIIDIRGVLAIIGKMIVLLRNVAIRRS